MAVLVDEAVWPWRGERWAHLVSDVDLDELHGFAALLGLRRMAFQGDHYDVRAEARLRALDLGAVPVPARELLARLRAAGLRLPPGRRPGPWTEAGRWAAGDPVPAAAGGMPAVLVEALAVARAVGPVEVSAWYRGGEWALAVSASSPVAVRGLPAGVEHRLTDGGCHLELLAGG